MSDSDDDIFARRFGASGSAVAVADRSRVTGGRQLVPQLSILPLAPPVAPKRVRLGRSARNAKATVPTKREAVSLNRDDLLHVVDNLKSQLHAARMRERKADRC